MTAFSSPEEQIKSESRDQTRRGNITEYHHQGKKQEAGIEVVVEGEGPEVPYNKASVKMIQ